VRLDSIWITEGDLKGRNATVIFDYLLTAYRQRELYVLQGDKSTEIADKLRSLDFYIKQFESVIFSEIPTIQEDDYTRAFLDIKDRYEKLRDRVEGVINNKPLVSISVTRSHRPSSTPTASVSYNIYVEDVCSPSSTPSITPSLTPTRSATKTVPK
jgi:hypothetical protein